MVEKSPYYDRYRRMVKRYNSDTISEEPNGVLVAGDDYDSLLEVLRQCVEAMDEVVDKLFSPGQPMIGDPFRYYGRMIQKNLASAREKLDGEKV